ncbi:unnamed protein product [Schistocephalus solidus]|uniref:PIN domain-containing protein n=1 Tax=Schistocephalus solidus TaxID=70667 RepID=A0A183TN81_SCHSO|nr:unnamed protein product [Schistocephalus solidus]
MLAIRVRCQLGYSSIDKAFISAVCIALDISHCEHVLRRDVPFVDTTFWKHLSSESADGGSGGGGGGDGDGGGHAPQGAVASVVMATIHHSPSHHYRALSSALLDA